MPEARFAPEYIAWLCDIVGIYTRDTRSEILLNALIEKEFYWTVPNDDNRVQDGLRLREEFADMNDISIEEAFVGPCTIFEMLIALARRCSEQMYDFDDQDNPSRWFWEFMENLGLDFCSRTDYDEDYTTEVVNNVLERLVERTYSESGRHGLFPLNNPKQDQRKVELWYQMSAYLTEHYF